MTVLVYNGNDKHIKICTEYANNILLDHAFHKFIIDEVEEFTHTTVNDIYIVEVLKRFISKHLTIEVKTYFRRITRATAYFTSSRPFDINVNLAKKNRKEDWDENVASMINTLVHEPIHAIDHWDKDHSYGHGTNDSGGKALSVPYLVGLLAERYYLIKYAGRPQTSISNAPRQEIKKIVIPWYKRAFNWIRSVF